MAVSAPVPSAVAVDLVVTRADGTVENLGVRSYYHRNARRMAAVNKLIARGVCFSAQQLKDTPTFVLLLRAALSKKGA